MKPLDFEIWSIRGDKTFSRIEPYGDGSRCRGSNGQWEAIRDNHIRITLYPDTNTDTTMTISYQVNGEEMTLQDMGTKAKTIWKRLEVEPLLEMLNRGYCMGEA